MRISHKFKFIWVSKPKTGSTSYRELLDPYCEVKSTSNGDFYHHSSLIMIERLFEKYNWNFGEYKKIVPVRNPYKLLVSLYTYSKMDVHGVKWWEANSKRYDSNNLMDFTSFMTNTKNIAWFRNMHRLERYVLDMDGKCRADFIFDPSSDESKFKDYLLKDCALDLKGKEVPWINTTAKSAELLNQVKAYFSNDHISGWVDEMFAYEITLFNYKNPFV